MENIWGSILKLEHFQVCVSLPPQERASLHQAGHTHWITVSLVALLTRVPHAASPVLTKGISSCLEPWRPQMPMSTSLTRSRKDVHHALWNASLQGQLCKLQGCEWGHLRGQERRLGQEELGSEVLPSSPSSLDSKQGEAGMVGRLSRGSPIIGSTANPASFPHGSSGKLGGRPASSCTF